MNANIMNRIYGPLFLAISMVAGIGIGSFATRTFILASWGGPGDHIATAWRNQLDSVVDGQGNLRSDDETTTRILSTVNAATFGVARLYDKASPEWGQRFAQEVARRIEANPHLHAHGPDPIRSAALRRCILVHADMPAQVVECSLDVLGQTDRDPQTRFGMTH